MKVKLNNNYQKTLLLAFLLIIANSEILTQSKINIDHRFIPILDSALTESEFLQISTINKRSGHKTSEDWRTLIDSYWGSGLPTPEKLRIFDLAWKTVDEEYAAFQNLSIDIDSLRNLYRPEIAGGVSRGRFAAIMNHFALALKECHTTIFDIPVNWGTEISPGTPLLVIGPWYNNERFGASLTPLPDSSLLVYRALENHKLGLEKGDIVLGYDGVPWKEKYKELLEVQLPISLNWVWGSNDKSITHCILASVGLNWHLFDTLDIVKYESGDTLHLPTYLLENQNGIIWGNEQLDVPGVEWPNIFRDDYVNWGIVEETQIGYVYVTAWTYDAKYGISQQFYNAIDSLMHHYKTTGIIIDMRLNYGGGGTSHRGFSLLFDSSFNTMRFNVRCDANDHFKMCPHPTFHPDMLRITGNPASYYDKPIAVLTGPGTVSAGDVESVRLGYHPMVKFFGKSSAGAFCTSDYPDLENSDWFFYLSTGNAYTVSNHKYLAHTELEMYKDVWLTQQGVVNNKDDVVEAAIEWINNPTSVNKTSYDINSDYHLGNNYPNPFNPITTIIYQIPKSSYVTLKVYDVLGNEVTILVNEIKSRGSYEVEFNSNELPSGVYFYRLKSMKYTKSRKMLLIK